MLKKYKENLNPEKEYFDPKATEKKESKTNEKLKSTYQNIDYLREKIAINNGGLLDRSIIEKIKYYYHKEYEKQWDILLKEHKDFSKIPTYESANDSIAYLKFAYMEGKKEDSLTIGMMHCSIPLKQGINLYMSSPVLYTDLDNDDINDLIVVVHTEGGWRGGNTYNQDIFVFLNEKGSYKLANVTGDWEMINPDTYGYIRVKNVENGILMADASIYTEKDARCCPSDHYFMKYKFEDNKFVIVSSEFIGSEY